MLKTLIRIFGFEAPPPPPPKRRKTARKTPAPKPAAPVPAAPPAPVRRVQDVVPLPNFALALRTYIRQWGKHGPKPSQDRLDAAAHALGPDYAAFLTALHMVDGALTRFLVPESSLTNPAVDRGMQEKICLACYSELDVWKEAEKIDLRQRTIARQGGSPIPPALHVPEEVRAALLKRLTDDAARLLRGGGQGGKGSVKPKPPEAMGAPEPVMLDPEGGGRSRVAGGAEPSDEATSDNEAEGGAPAFRKPSSGGKRRDDDAEETATGKHQPPPPSPEDGEPEGGGLGLPRF